MKTLLPLTALLLPLAALTACGGGEKSAAGNAAEQLEDAAEMSNPAAAPVLENGAEQVREQDNAALAQNVLQEAGNAQAK
jgi:hypothetical protein